MKLEENSNVDNRIVTGRKDEERFERKIGWSRFNITVEPVRFCDGFTFGFTNGIIIDLIEKKACELAYPTLGSNCTLLMDPQMKARVEGETATINMVNLLIQALCPMILSIFIGPWSDTNGRKQFIILPFIGYWVYYLIWGLISPFSNLPLYVYVIASIPLSLSGGRMALTACSMSYINDITQPKNRALRFGILGASCMVGGILGNTILPILLKYTGDWGYQMVFFISFIISATAALYSVYVLPETIDTKENESSRLFDVTHLKESIRVLIIHPRKGRLAMLFIQVILAGEILTLAGDSSVVYLVGKNQFSWTLWEYNIYQIVIDVFNALWHVSGVWLFKNKLKLDNFTILTVFLPICISMEITKGLSTSDLMFWLSASAQTLFSAIGAFSDDELFGSVAQEDAGKASTYISLLDGITPLLATFLYSELYEVLLPNKTCYVFFLSACLLFPACISALSLTSMDKFCNRSSTGSDSNLIINDKESKNTYFSTANSTTEQTTSSTNEMQFSKHDINNNCIDQDAEFSDLGKDRRKIESKIVIYCSNCGVDHGKMDGNNKDFLTDHQGEKNTSSVDYNGNCKGISDWKDAISFTEVAKNFPEKAE